MFGIEIEADLAGTMLYIVNTDAPGFIGKLGTALGEAGINIGTFNLGRRKAGGEAVALVAVDGKIGPEVVKTLCALEGVRKVVPLDFRPQASPRRALPGPRGMKWPTSP